MEYPLVPPDRLKSVEKLIDDWMAVQEDEENAVLSVERDTSTDLPRWVVRLEGEEKSFIAVWFTLGQRSLHAESYFMPAPEENQARLFEYLLRRAGKMVGFGFVIGVEDAVFLDSRIPVGWVNVAELDRLLGSVYTYTEHSFRPAMRIGFESRFKG